MTHNYLNNRYPQSNIYQSLNTNVLIKVPKNAESILDIGCGAGTIGKKIKEDINCQIVGVTYSEAEAQIASQNLDRVIICDLNEFQTDDLGKFDCIICSHILEHLYQPQNLLKRLHINLKPNAIMIVALPNTLHWKQRLEFIRGKFRYTDGGLMDRTHFRFYDWQTAHELLQESGYEILNSEADGSFPLPGVRKFLPALLSCGIDHKAVQNFPGLFGFQFIFSCRSEFN
jgi:SAM-dependent methyltransferase